MNAGHPKAMPWRSWSGGAYGLAMSSAGKRGCYETRAKHRIARGAGRHRLGLAGLHGEAMTRACPIHLPGAADFQPMEFKLAWRYSPRGVDWDSTRRAALLTPNGETVAEIGVGRAAGGFYWRIFHPQAWVIADDPEARATRDAMGQDAVVTWGGPVHSRAKAARELVDRLDRMSIGLFGLDVLPIADFKTNGASND